MLQYKNKIGIILLIVITVLSSCKKGFLDVNNNPNQSTDDNITPELLAVQAAEATGARMASGNFRFLNSWVGYMSASGDFAIIQDETTYNIDFTFGEGIWGNHYDVLHDLELAKRKAVAKQDLVLAGTQMVLSAKLWQELVDVFGNIPYSQAFNYQATRTPAYDKATDIYIDLQKKLDSAIQYLKGTPRSNFNNYIGKVVKINQAQWVKFANTLKLRLLIRQSQVSGFNPASEITKIVTNGGVLGAGENVNVNPGYVDDDNKQNPFYGNYGYTPTGADANTSTRANQYIINLMAANEDPRLDRYFQVLSNGAIVGTTFGLPEGNPRGASSSKFGPAVADNAEQDQWIMPAFESMFFEAEAIARGWMPGNAKTAYENAVKEAFVWAGVEDAADAAATYMADNASANWATVSNGTTLAKARFIALQKYIALTYVDPMESWADIRRLNMLTDNGYISVNPAKISTVLPSRLLYPQSEYTTNSANVNAQGTINQFSSKLFWQP